MSALTEAYYYSQSHIASLMKANQIMNDGSIEPRSEYVLHKLFASMDKLVHIRPDYGFCTVDALRQNIWT